MGYSIDSTMVRVDFFRDMGKWYTTEALNMGGEKNPYVYEAFIKALGKQFPEHYHDLVAVCLEPYHENAHPLMILDWWNKYLKLTKE